MRVWVVPFKQCKRKEIVKIIFKPRIRWHRWNKCKKFNVLCGQGDLLRSLGFGGPSFVFVGLPCGLHTLPVCLPHPISGQWARPPAFIEFECSQWICSVCVWMHPCTGWFFYCLFFPGGLRILMSLAVGTIHLIIRRFERASTMVFVCCKCHS